MPSPMQPSSHSVELPPDEIAISDALGLSVDGSAEERARRWIEENREAIDASNEELRRRGLWSDRLRQF